MADNEAKLLEVQNWLQNTLGTVDIPDFTVNAETVNFLHQLMQRNRCVDQQYSVITQDAKERAAEYTAKADQLGQVLQRLQISPNQLSESVQKKLNSLAAISTKLGVASPSHADVCLAVTDLSDKEYDVTSESGAIHRSTRLLQRDMKTAVQRLATLERSLSELSETAKRENQDAINQQKETTFFQRKSSQYNMSINSLQTRLKSSGYNESLDHHELEKTAQKLENLLESLRPVKKQLQGYHSLPPDVSLARVRIEEAKRELSQLDFELSKFADLAFM